MMEIEEVLVQDLSRIAAYIILYLVLFTFAKWIKDFITPYSLNNELTKKDNLAVAITMAGYYMALVAIFIGAMLGPSSDNLLKDIQSVGSYSILGLVLLNLSRFINDRVLLRRFSNIEELTVEHNIAVASVQFGSYLATGIIAAAAIHGTGGGVVTTLVFFVLGQFSLHLFSLVYDWLTPYSIHEELKNKNTAAGIAFGGTLIALGLIIFNGASGDFTTWQESLTDFFILNLVAFVFLPVARWIMDRLVIPGDDLSREIQQDRNIGAGFLEATVAISFSLVLFIAL